MDISKVREVQGRAISFRSLRGKSGFRVAGAACPAGAEVSATLTGTNLRGHSGMKTILGSTLAVVTAFHARAAVIPAQPTVFLRTNTASGDSTEFVRYASLVNLAAGIASGQPNIDFIDHGVNDIFWDGERFYRTYTSFGKKTKIYSWDSLDAYGDNTKATIHNLSYHWSSQADIWSDQAGNFYRTSVPVSGLSWSITKYTSFTKLINGFAGAEIGLTTAAAVGDRFWVYDGTFYRTTTGGGHTLSIVSYASLEALAANSPIASVSTVAYGVGDTFMFIPAPGAVTLLGMAGLACARRRR